jgi:hypothetical protein
MMGSFLVLNTWYSVMFGVALPKIIFAAMELR